MGLTVDIAIVTSAWGDYWDRFGAQWIATIEGVDPQPTQVILVTPTIRPAPSWVQQVLHDDLHMGMMLNAGVTAVEATWVHHHGLDDLLLVGAYEPVHTSADCISFPHLYGGDLNGVAAYSGGYEEMYLLGNNPMLGGFFHRTQLLREMPYRRLGYCDEAHFAEMAWFGKSIAVTAVPRSIWVRHPDAHSYNANHMFQVEVNAFKQRLVHGLVQMGVAEC